MTEEFQYNTVFYVLTWNFAAEAAFFSFWEW